MTTFRPVSVNSTAPPSRSMKCAGAICRRLISVMANRAASQGRNSCIDLAPAFAGGVENRPALDFDAEHLFQTKPLPA